MTSDGEGLAGASPADGLAALPVPPPVEPMLARLARTLPDEPDLCFEPKWDGFRALAFRAGSETLLASRRQRGLGRYFPEIVEGLLAVAEERFVVDGEIVVAEAGGLAFSTLLARLHPATSVVERLRREAPATFVAFDALATGDHDLRGLPFSDRRSHLERLLDGAPPTLVVTPMTTDRDVARRWMDRYHGAGIDGVVAKPADLRYEPGRRVMTKVKPERTADCVVGGIRPVLQEEPAVASLLLGLYEGEALRHVGVAAAFRAGERVRLAQELAPLVTTLEGHPWEHGFGIAGGRLGRLPGAAGRWTPDQERDWVPLRPERVCEVVYDNWGGDRFRHAVRLSRWRPDRDPLGCTFDQFPPPTGPEGDLVALRR